MILCIGEILADMIGEKRDGVESFAFHAGGAPFNVACCVANLGGSAGFIGRVGDDSIGRKLHDFACKRNLNLQLQCDKNRNTTLAFVSLDDSGERSFCFYRKNTADGYIDFAEAAPEIEKADLVHLGSLMLGEARGREFADEVVNAAHKAGKLLSFDVNYREDIYPDARAAAEISRKYIEKADIVKLSQEEVTLLYGDTDGLIKAAGKNKTVCVTLGAKGSMCISGGEIYRAPSIEVHPIDTTGAGDAFYGAFLLARAEGKSVPDSLRFANVCGALTTKQKGAIEALPSRDEIMKLL